MDLFNYLQQIKRAQNRDYQSAITPELTSEVEEINSRVQEDGSIAPKFNQTFGLLDVLINNNRGRKQQEIDEERRRYERGATDEEIKSAYDIYTNLEKTNELAALKFAADRPKIFGKVAVQKYNLYTDPEGYYMGKYGGQNITGREQLINNPEYNLQEPKQTKEQRLQGFIDKYGMTPEQMRERENTIQTIPAGIERDAFYAQAGTTKEKIEAKERMLDRQGDISDIFAVWVFVLFLYIICKLLKPVIQIIHKITKFIVNIFSKKEPIIKNIGIFRDNVFYVNNKRFTGKAKEYYKDSDNIPTKRLKYVENYKNGKLHGVYRKYYENENLEIIGHYKNNKKIGKWRCFSNNGDYLKTEIYKRDELIDTFK